MTRKVRLATALVVGVGLGQPVGPSASVANELPVITKSAVVLPAIPVRSDVTADIALTVFTNRYDPCAGGPVLAVHGMLHTAAAWEPFVTALFDRLPFGEQPCRVFALDLPGHGRSSAPSGALFGELTLDDYVTAVLETLNRLHAIGVYPETLVGHSLGGAILPLMQQRLAAQGTTLRLAHGVRNVVLLAAAVLNPIEFAEWDSGAALAPFHAYAQESPELGRYIAYPVAMWRNPLFKNLVSPPQFAAGTPTVDEIVARGYFGPPGSLTAVESRGMLESMVPRPSVDALLFHAESGTRLTMIVYEQDRLVSVDRSMQFYVHLTGDPIGTCLVVVQGPNAVHDTHVSNPPLVLDTMGPLARVF